MLNYIDKDKLIRDLIDNRNFYPAIVKRAIENAPTEDVVPRAEIARLQSILLQFTDIVHKWGAKHNFDTTEISLVPILEQEADSIIEKAKQEVAKQIFEEIDTTIRTDIKANNRYYGDYQEGRNNAFYTVIRQLAELKKKYIGE